MILVSMQLNFIKACFLYPESLLKFEFVLVDSNISSYVWNFNTDYVTPQFCSAFFDILDLNTS